MAETFAVKIAKEQAKLKRQSSTATAAQRLQHASIEDTFLPVKDREGQVVATWGKQPDGSFGGSVKQSPAQPTPSAPILPVPVEGERVPNNFPVEWDGNVVSGVVPEVHGYTGVWYQMVDDESAVDAEAWRLGGSIRDRLGGATTIVVPGTGMVAVAFQMVGADRVTKGPFSAPSFVTVTARVDAQDIADRLDAFADGELPDGAYDNLMVRLGEFMQIRADQIDVNSLAADQAFIGLLEAAGIVLSDEAGGRRFTVSGQGWRLEDTDNGQVMAQLGTHGDDFLSLHDAATGDPTFSVSGAGGVSAVQFSSQGDMSVAGKPLAGSQFGGSRWHSSNSVVETTALGTMPDHLRTFGSNFSTTSDTGLVIVHQDFYVEPGRMYHFVCHDFQMGNREPYYMQAYYTSSTDRTVRPALPGPTSASQGPSMGRVPPSTFSGGTSLSYSFFYHNTQNYRMRISWVVGNASTSNALSFGSAQRNFPRCQVLDMGPRVNYGGSSSIARSIDNTSEGSMVQPSEMLTGSYSGVETATYTLNPTTGLATRQYFGGQPRFGRWSNGTYYVTLVDFADWNAQAGTPRSANFSVRIASWVNAGRGNIYQASIPNTPGLPASFNLFTGATNFANPTGVAAGVPNTATPTGGLAEELITRPRATIAIGRTGWSGLSDGLPASGVLDTARMLARLNTEIGVPE